MKLYKNLLLAFTICLGTSSCLDLDSQDQLADGNMWKTADDFKYFANNFYGWTRDFSTIISDGPHSDWRSDLMTSSSINQFSHGNNSIPTSDGNYTGAYSNIRRCNILLQKAQEYSGSQSIAQYISEAKFFRAYNYFELLQLYGDAIITDKPFCRKYQNGPVSAPNDWDIDWILLRYTDVYMLYGEHMMFHTQSTIMFKKHQVQEVVIMPKHSQMANM